MELMGKTELFDKCVEYYEMNGKRWYKLKDICENLGMKSVNVTYVSSKISNINTIKKKVSVNKKEKGMILTLINNEGIFELVDYYEGWDIFNFRKYNKMLIELERERLLNNRMELTFQEEMMYKIDPIKYSLENIKKIRGGEIEADIYNPNDPNNKRFFKAVLSGKDECDYEKEGIISNGEEESIKEVYDYNITKLFDVDIMTYTINNNKWYNTPDICTIFGYSRNSTTNLRSVVSKDNIYECHTKVKNRQTQKTKLINIYGVFEIIDKHYGNYIYDFKHRNKELIKTERERLIKKEDISVEIKEKINNINEEEQMELTIIEQREVLGKDFKIYGDVENPLFLAKDVSEWIEHNKSSELINNVDEDEKLKAIVSHSGQNREMWFLTEEGLYEVLMSSRKSIAKQFKKQVKSILKDIRKNGMYATDELLNNPDLLIQVATKLKEEREERRKLELENKRIAIEKKLAEDTLEIQKPKVEYYNEVLDYNGSMTTTQVAKSLGISSATSLNRILKDAKVLYKVGGQWVLTAPYVGLGYTKEKSYANDIGTLYKNTQWTEKGKKFIYDLLVDLQYIKK
jgi:prophage antirepressor-like protein